MDGLVQDRLRQAATAKRRGPREPSRTYIPYDLDGDLDCGTRLPPDELVFRVTDADGNIAQWLTDHWWMGVVQHWSEDPLAVKIAATPNAVLHPILLHQLVMLRRVAPKWRLIGHVSLSEHLSSEQIDTLAVSPYHELRFFDPQVDDDVPSAGVAGRADFRDDDRASRGGQTVHEIFGIIREVQRQFGLTKPVLVRLTCTNDDAGLGQPGEFARYIQSNL